MIEVKRGWKNVRDREKWAARGATLVARAKATKVVWFPPKPVDTGKKAASTAKRPTRAAKKGTKKVTNPVRRKKA